MQWWLFRDNDELGSFWEVRSDFWYLRLKNELRTEMRICRMDDGWYGPDGKLRSSVANEIERLHKASQPREVTVVVGDGWEEKTPGQRKAEFEGKFTINIPLTGLQLSRPCPTCLKAEARPKRAYCSDGCWRAASTAAREHSVRREMVTRVIECNRTTGVITCTSEARSAVQRAPDAPYRGIRVSPGDWADEMENL